MGPFLPWRSWYTPLRSFCAVLHPKERRCSFPAPSCQAPPSPLKHPCHEDQFTASRPSLLLLIQSGFANRPGPKTKNACPTETSSLRISTACRNFCTHSSATVKSPRLYSRVNISSNPFQPNLLGCIHVYPILLFKPAFHWILGNLVGKLVQRILMVAHLFVSLYHETCLIGSRWFTLHKRPSRYVKNASFCSFFLYIW